MTKTFDSRAVLGRDFTAAGQLSFAFPRILMSLFIMSYLVADGALISHYLGTDALAALNLVFPLSALLGAVGIMLSAGGGSVTGRRLGAGDREAASRSLSSILITEAAIGLLLGVLGLVLLEPIMTWLSIGPDEAPYARDYQRIALAALPLLFLSNASQTFFTTAGFPKVGLAASIAAGLTNVALDILFMGPMELGMTGAALATALSWLVCAVTGIVFFARRGSPIALRLMIPERLAVLRSAASGISEMVGSLSAAVTLFLFNTAFMERLGAEGVAALAIAMYSTYVFNCIFYGFCEANAPLLSYKYGNQDWPGLEKVFRNALVLLGVLSLGAFLLSRILAEPVLGVFVSKESPVFALVLENFKYYSVSLLFIGPNFFGAYFFTAFGDGKRAAAISFCRTFLFMAIAVSVLPKLFGDFGLWISAPAAEGAAFLLALTLVLSSRRRYGCDGKPAKRINKA